MKSYDDGKSWTEPTVLFQHHFRGVWVPEMFLNGDKIILFVATLFNNMIVFKMLLALVGVVILVFYKLMKSVDNA